MHRLLVSELTSFLDDDGTRASLIDLTPEKIDHYTVRVKPMRYKEPNVDGRPWAWEVVFESSAPSWYRECWICLGADACYQGEEDRAQASGHGSSSSSASRPNDAMAKSQGFPIRRPSAASRRVQR